MQFAGFKRLTYSNYKYPLWADILGWCFVAFEMALIPGVAIYKVVTMKEKLPIMEVDNFNCFMDGKFMMVCFFLHVHKRLQSENHLLFLVPSHTFSEVDAVINVVKTVSSTVTPSDG